MIVRIIYQIRLALIWLVLMFLQSYMYYLCFTNAYKWAIIKNRQPHGCLILC